MTEVVTTGTITTDQARESLAEIVDAFDAGRGEPVYFGSDQQHAQAVIVPVAVWEALVEADEDEADVRLAAQRLREASGETMSMEEFKRALLAAVDAAENSGG